MIGDGVTDMEACPPAVSVYELSNIQYFTVSKTGFKSLARFYQIENDLSLVKPKRLCVLNAACIVLFRLVFSIIGINVVKVTAIFRESFVVAYFARNEKHANLQNNKLSKQRNM